MSPQFFAFERLGTTLLNYDPKTFFSWTELSQSREAFDEATKAQGYGTLYAHVGSRNWAYPRKWIRGSMTNLVSLHFEQELEEKEEKESKAKALAKEEAFHHIKNPKPKKNVPNHEGGPSL